MLNPKIEELWSVARHTGKGYGGVLPGLDRIGPRKEAETLAKRYAKNYPGSAYYAVLLDGRGMLADWSQVYIMLSEGTEHAKR